MKTKNIKNIWLEVIFLQGLVLTVMFFINKLTGWGMGGIFELLVILIVVGIIHLQIRNKMPRF